MSISPEDIPKAIEATGEAISETAKVTSRIVKFVDKCTGELMGQLGGALADRVIQYRILNTIKFIDKVELLHGKWGIQAVRAVAPEYVLPILEAAAIEDDDDLRLRYACLLANYMDSESKIDPKSAYLQMLEGMSPLDLVVLRSLYYESQQVIKIGNGQEFIRGIAYTNVAESSIARDLKISSIQEILPSLDNLVRIYCVTQSGGSWGLQHRGKDQLYYGNPTNFQVTALGESFLLACEPELREGESGR